MGHHAMMQIFDAAAPGAFKEKRKNSVQQAGESGNDHPAAETKRHAHMLNIALADARWMLSESAFDHGAEVPVYDSQWAAFYARKGEKFFYL